MQNRIIITCKLASCPDCGIEPEECICVYYGGNLEELKQSLYKAIDEHVKLANETEEKRKKWMNKLKTVVPMKKKHVSKKEENKIAQVLKEEPKIPQVNFKVGNKEIELYQFKYSHYEQPPFRAIYPEIMTLDEWFDKKYSEK